MLLRTPRLDAEAVIVNFLIFDVCVEKQSAAKHVTQSAGKKRRLHSLKEYPALPIPSLMIPLPKYFLRISSWYQFSFVQLFYFWKFNFTYFSHNYRNYSMFRYIPECSGFYRRSQESNVKRLPRPGQATSPSQDGIVVASQQTN